MFTGIITNLGKVLSKTDKILQIKAERSFLVKTEKGTSISINGICLTTVEVYKDYFIVDFIPETENRTNIKYLQKNTLVNLELPVTPITLLSGHILQGHIDGISKLLEIQISGNSRILKLSATTSLTKYIVEKGSIAVNGISLTVIKARNDYFTVGIIPYTWDNTMLHTIKTGDFLNVEVDVLAKYIEKLL